MFEYEVSDSKVNPCLMNTDDRNNRLQLDEEDEEMVRLPNNDDKSSHYSSDSSEEEALAGADNGKIGKFP